MNESGKSLILLLMLLLVLVATIQNTVFAFKAREDLNAIEKLEFRADEIYIPQTQVPLSEIINSLPNKDAWMTFSAQQKDAIIYFDPRSGRPVSFIYPYPIIPGTGEGNHITLATLSTQLGYPVTQVTSEVVKDLLMQHLRKFNNLLRINLNEIGETRVDQVSEVLWHANFRRQVNGIPVKDSRIAFAINNGNLVLWGTEGWGDVNINTTPTISKDTAIDIAFRHIGGKLDTDRFTVRPHLEIIPINPKQWDGSIGKGYDYALVWVFNFQREGFQNNWEFVVDAHSGKILSFLDKNMYITKKIVGAIYPISNDECCPDGCAVAETPFPYINTGFSAPNNYTDYGGKYDYTSGTAITTLNGLYVNINEGCGAVTESSSTGDIDLGGTNGQHNCQSPPGHSPGDVFAARSLAAEITHINRQVKSWLNLSWLDSYITCKT